jgi:acyl CoA:acetate/3-ketoacid CoA transferase
VLDQAGAHNGGIAQVKRVVRAGSLKPQQVHVPGVLVDHVVIDPDQKQTTQILYDPAISGEISRPEDGFEVPEWGPEKVIARRAALELWSGAAVNLGFGISANVPRILLEEGLHGQVTWVIEQGAVGGIPLLGFAFGCAANADAIVPSPNQFAYSRRRIRRRFAVVPADRPPGQVNVSKLSSLPHSRLRRVRRHHDPRSGSFSGFFTAGARLQVGDGRLTILQEGKSRKLVTGVEHVTFSGQMARRRRQCVTYITERCVVDLASDGLTVREIAPGIDLQRDVLAQSEFPLNVAADLKIMDAALFRDLPTGLKLPEKRRG